MERRSCSVRQMEMLVEFAETHRDLALGRLRSKEARALAKRLWQECANTLNSEGPARTSSEWTKVWNDTKCRVRAKLTAAAVARRGTGGGPCHNVALSSLEERVADIIGRDIGPISNVSQNQFVATEEHQEQVEVIQIMEEMAVPNENNGALPIEFEVAGPGPSSRPSIQRTPASIRTSPVPSTVTSTPRRGRQRPRPRQRNAGASRARPQIQTSRSVLDESRAMVLRIEELRARTDCTLAQAALAQAEAAKAQADASLLQSQSVASFCQALSGLLPAIQLYLKSQTRRCTRRIIPSASASEDEN